MLKDLIAQAFCRDIQRKLRRLGVLGAIVGAYFALHVELPLGISIATKETQAAMAGIEQSMKRGLARSKHPILELHRPPAQHAKGSQPRASANSDDGTKRGVGT